MEKNVLEFLENSQRMYGEKTACADMNNELTYTQLMNQAKFIGSCLSLKIKPTQGVPVYMDKTCNTLSLFMGIVYAGGYYCTFLLLLIFLRRLLRAERTFRRHL